jgi:hypothetical protein
MLAEINSEESIMAVKNRESAGFLSVVIILICVSITISGCDGSGDAIVEPIDPDDAEVRVKITIRVEYRTDYTWVNPNSGVNVVIHANYDDEEYRKCFMQYLLLDGKAVELWNDPYGGSEYFPNSLPSETNIDCEIRFQSGVRFRTTISGLDAIEVSGPEDGTLYYEEECRLTIDDLGSFDMCSLSSSYEPTFTMKIFAPGEIGVPAPDTTNGQNAYSSLSLYGGYYKSNVSELITGRALYYDSHTTSCYLRYPVKLRE